jgi:hypothetical protein
MTSRRYFKEGFGKEQCQGRTSRKVLSRNDFKEVFQGRTLRKDFKKGSKGGNKPVGLGAALSFEPTVPIVPARRSGK